VTITSLDLKNLLQFFPFSWAAMQVMKQIRKSPAKQVKSTGFGSKHYTQSLWEKEEELKHFARTDAHLAAMKKSALFAREIRTYTFDADALLDWRTAKKLLADHGKSLRF
jgi:hypothetical protein